MPSVKVDKIENLKLDFDVIGKIGVALIRIDFVDKFWIIVSEIFEPLLVTEIASEKYLKSIVIEFQV